MSLHSCIKKGLNKTILHEKLKKVCNGYAVCTTIGPVHLIKPVHLIGPLNLNVGKQSNKKVRIQVQENIETFARIITSGSL